LNETQKQLEEELKKACNCSAATPRAIKLPSKLGIEKIEKGLLLQVDAESVKANMQSDAAAVESWALVLRLWLGEKRVPHIVVDWDAPSDAPDGHYERFLYRMYQFSKLFPGWFEVADAQKLQKCKALCGTQLILNVASRRASQSQPRTTSREYQLEAELIKSLQFCEHFSLQRVDRQFPVGLFAGKVAADTRIFTGGKSAIDIVGVGKDDRFWIFELKAGHNFKVGILSELLLYTSLIREAAQKPPRIQFDNLKGNPRVGPEDVRNCTGINAVMLVENLHPLLEHPELLNTINQAAKTYWNSEPGAQPVCFSTARIDHKLLVSEFEVAAEASV
jgi:hypothetical protein